MKKVEVTGSTLEEAINKGLKLLNASREEVEIDILEEGKEGLFGLGGEKPYRIQLKMKEEILDAREIVERFLNELFRLMNFSIKKLDVSKEKYRINVIIESEDKDKGLLIGKDGKGIEAIEVLVTSIVNFKIPDRKRNFDVKIDINFYRRKLKGKVNKLIRETIEKLQRSGGSKEFEKLSPILFRTFQEELRNYPIIEYKIFKEEKKIIISLKE